MKQLFYDLSPEAYRLAILLTEYTCEVGTYKKTVKDRWILDPSILNKLLIKGYHPSTEEVWAVWQDLLRQAAFLNQGGRSLLTGKELNFRDLQLHHALVTKGTIRGMRGFNRHLIHHTYNCMVLDYNEHLDGQDGADNRRKCANVLSGIYGSGLVKMWHFSFSSRMKSRLPNIF